MQMSCLFQSELVHFYQFENVEFRPSPHVYWAIFVVEGRTKMNMGKVRLNSQYKMNVSKNC